MTKPSPFAGMTTYERLAEAELLEAFREAVEARERTRIMSLLVSVDMSETDAALTVDTLLANPAKYGYA